MTLYSGVVMDFDYDDDTTRMVAGICITELCI